MKFARKIVTILLLILIVISCVPSQPSEEYESLSFDRLINRLEANRRRIVNFEGSGIIKVSTPTLDNTSNFNVILIKPDTIFLSILGPFGIELGQALLTNKEFTFYDALSNTAYKGSVDSDALQNIFRIDLPFELIFDALTGSLNLTEQLYKNPDDYQITKTDYTLSYNDLIRKNKINIKVDRRRLSVIDYELKSMDSDLTIKGTFSNFEIIDNVPIPFIITIENKSSRQKLELNYKKIVLNNRSLSINFSIPDDAEIVKW